MMETVEDGEQPNTNAHISDIPEEVLELIFGHLSPYEDMKSVMLVCKQWHRVVSGQYFISVCRCVESLLLSSFLPSLALSLVQIYGIGQLQAFKGKLNFIWHDRKFLHRVLNTHAVDISVQS